MRALSDQVSLVVLHARRPDQVVLFTPPVSKTAEKVVGKETVNWIPDYVYVDRLLHPKPEREMERERQRGRMEKVYDKISNTLTI